MNSPRTQALPASAPPSPPTAEAFIGGDPLRALAALSVLGYHAAYFVVVSAHLGWFDRAYGRLPGALLGSLYLGLFVFFVLSGYLLSRPFVRSFVHGEPLPRLRPYVRHRLLRIVPAFWIILTIVLLCWGTMGASPGQLVATYGFLQNYGHARITQVIGQAWTLDVELAFYVLLPVAALAVSRGRTRLSERNRRRLLFGGLLTAAGASLCGRALGPGAITANAFAWQTSLPAMLFAFIPGIALAAIETTELPRKLRWSGSRLPSRLLLGAGVLVLAGDAARAQAVTPQYVDAIGALLAALGTGALVGGVLVRQWTTGGCWRALDNRVMRWVGERSYSLYLVHQPVLVAIVFSWSMPGISPGIRLAAQLALALGVSLIAAAGSYRYFERPFLRAHRRGENCAIYATKAVELPA